MDQAVVQDTKLFGEKKSSVVVKYPGRIRYNITLISGHVWRCFHQRLIELPEASRSTGYGHSDVSEVGASSKGGVGSVIDKRAPGHDSEQPCICQRRGHMFILDSQSSPDLCH